ncbi:MAG: YceI family protein [Nocardioidaceae bacterium]
MTDSGLTSVEVPATGAYRIDPERSTVHFEGRHWFGLAAVRATFAVASGEITVADPVEQSSVEVKVDSASFHSDQPRRDKHVASPALLDIASNPDITFSSSAIRRAADGWVVEGSVTAHGGTVSTELTVDRITPEDNGARVHARAEHLDRYAFGVTKVKGIAGRYFDLELDALLVPA